MTTMIRSTDPDAVERLTAKLARLEARRDRIKAYNRTCKKDFTEFGDLTLLAPQEQKEIQATVRVWRGVDFQCPGGKFPAYELTNLGAEIRRIKARIEELSCP